MSYGFFLSTLCIFTFFISNHFVVSRFDNYADERWKKTLLNVCSVCEFFLDLTLLYLHTQRSDTSNFNTIWVVSCTILYDSRQECEVNVISVFICFWEEFSLDHRFHFAVRIRFVCQMGSMQQTHVCEITSTVVSLSLFRILTCALRHILNRTTIVRSHY